MQPNGEFVIMRPVSCINKNKNENDDKQGFTDLQVVSGRVFLLLVGSWARRVQRPAITKTGQRRLTRGQKYSVAFPLSSSTLLLLRLLRLLLLYLHSWIAVHCLLYGVIVDRLRPMILKKERLLLLLQLLLRRRVVVVCWPTPCWTNAPTTLTISPPPTIQPHCLIGLFSLASI